MTKRLEQKSAFVVGGNSGIGLAIAAAFVTEGADVTIAGTNEEKNVRAVAELSELNGSGDVWSIQLDVSNRDACFEAVEYVVQHSGSIDVLVNGAGVYASRWLYQNPRTHQASQSQRAVRWQSWRSAGPATRRRAAAVTQPRQSPGSRACAAGQGCYPPLWRSAC